MFVIVGNQTGKARRRTSVHFSLESAPPPPVFMCPLPGTNPMEATVLRVRLSNEKDGYNPLYPEAEGQTRLS